MIAQGLTTSSNYRIYSEDDVHTLRFIKRARGLGFSIEEIRELLGLWQKERIAELQTMVNTVEHLARYCHGDHRPECPILDDLGGATPRKRALTVQGGASPAAGALSTLDRDQAALARTAQAVSMATTSMRRWSVALFAALLLLAQLSTAGQVCVMARDRAIDEHDIAMADQPCGSLPMDAPVCMMHCLEQDQSASPPDQHFTAIASSAAVRPIDFTLAAIRAPSRPLSDSRLHVPRTPQILYCSYQS